MKTRFRRWMFMLVLLASARAATAADPLDEAQQSAREWVKLRVESSRLDAAWQSERALVESTLAALKKRAVLLEEKRDLAKAKTAQDRAEFDALRAKSQAAGEDLRACESRLQALIAKLVALRPNLPPRLSDALEMSYRSLATPTLPFGERLQIAVNALNRCAQFNRQITAGEDVLTIGGEATAKSFEVIYWGLSHGYAVDRAGRKAWLGAPGPGGWRWEPRPDAFAPVLELLAIARDKADPAFVAVPAAVTRSVAQVTTNSSP